MSITEQLENACNVSQVQHGVSLDHSACQMNTEGRGINSILRPCVRGAADESPSQVQQLAAHKNRVDSHLTAESGECLVSVWRRYRKGEQAAFTPIDNAYRSRLAGWLRHTFSSGYHDYAAQDALSVLAEKKPPFNTERQLYAWLKTTARRLVINANRRRRPSASSSLLEGF